MLRNLLISISRHPVTLTLSSRSATRTLPVPYHLYSAAAVPPKLRVPIQLTFQQVKRELAKPTTVVIDVREPQELVKDGKISQNAKNIPLGKLEDAFRLSDEEFEKTYGFQKPGATTTMIVHCKLGIRAAKGAMALSNSGFQNVIVYPGLVDWIENGGELVQ